MRSRIAGAVSAALLLAGANRDFSFARCNSGDGPERATNPPSVWREEG